MYIDSLVIETTRRCNLECLHCLRGKAQRISQKREYINALFRNIKYVSVLTLSGGEPSLVPHVIHMIIDEALYHHVEISNFFIATNGKKITPKFVEAVGRLHAFCTENECSSVEWSNDIYHGKPTYNNGFEELQLLEYARPRWKQKDIWKGSYFQDGLWAYRTGGIIGQGNAEENGIANRDVDIETIKLDDGVDQDRVTEGAIYLNCKGWIINDCNWSFETQDDPTFEGRICHVYDFSFKKMLQYQHVKIEYDGHSPEPVESLTELAESI